MTLTDTEIQTRAREIRTVTEPLAAGVYFAPEAQEEYRALGLDYVESYFCSRGACLGPAAPWSVVCAAFAAFKPAVVEAAVAGGRTKTTAEALLDARERGATAQLERILGDLAAPAELARATEILFAATDGVDPSGRALYAGLSVLDRPSTPFGAFWRAADLVREHRGDGHIASWIPHVDSTEITVLTEIAWGIPRRTYVFTRGWDETDVAAAEARLTARGLLAGDELTPAGAALRARIETDTDRSTRAVIERIGADHDELIAILRPWADGVVAAGGYPAPAPNLAVGS
jgi:hypothetical protein